MNGYNLGSNDRHVAGYKSVDIAEPCDIMHDLNVLPWPGEDSSLDEILAYDVCEHLNSRIDFINECWRLLRNGGRLHITTPNAAKGGGFYQDLTHVTPWTINSAKYFCVRPDGSDCLERARFHRHYGIKARFKPIHIKESHYQDSAIGPGCATPDPVYKLDFLFEAIK